MPAKKPDPITLPREAMGSAPSESVIAPRPRMPFSKLGETVDLTQQNYDRALAFAKDGKAASLIKVTIIGANHGDGSQQLANALTEVVAQMLDDLVEDALTHLEKKAQDARADLAQAFRTTSVEVQA